MPAVGASPGIDDGNVDGRGSIGVVAGPAAIGAALAVILILAGAAFFAGFAAAFPAGFALDFGFALALRAAF